MFYALNLLKKSYIEDDYFKDIEGTIKEYSRKVYFMGNEYNEFSLRISLLVDDGDFFKKTIAFSIVINTFDYKLRLCTGYKNEETIYSVCDYAMLYRRTKHMVALLQNNKNTKTNIKIAI